MQQINNQHITPPLHHKSKRGYKSIANEYLTPELKRAENNRLDWLDISKGIGIILVIIDHCLGPFNQQISYFHMPLFFIIAGITFKKKSLVKFLIGKINRIMIPWIFWSIISAILSLIPHGYGGPFNGPLWFLQNIFVALIIVYLTTILDRKYLKYAFICILLISFVTINIPELSHVLPFGLPLALISAQFIIVGVVLRQHDLFLSHSKIQTVSLLIVFSVLFCIICYYLATQGVKGIYVSLTLFRSDFIGSYLASIAGSLMVIFLSIIIKHNKVLEWLGRQSLVIMCVHFPFCMILNGYLDSCPYFTTTLNKLMLVICEWVFVTIVSCGICVICQRYIPRLTGYKSLIRY